MKCGARWFQEFCRKEINDNPGARAVRPYNYRKDLVSLLACLLDHRLAISRFNRYDIDTRRPCGTVNVQRVVARQTGRHHISYYIIYMVSLQRCG